MGRRAGAAPAAKTREPASQPAGKLAALNRKPPAAPISRDSTIRKSFGLDAVAWRMEQRSTPRRRSAVKPSPFEAVNGTSNVAEHKKGAPCAAPSARELLGRRSQVSLLLCRDGLAGGSMGWGAEVQIDAFF